MAASHPSGTVTFLFTDIEGSTQIAQRHRDQWEALRLRHHAILQQAIGLHDGYVFEIVGDAFCASFHAAVDAVHAAVEAQRQLAHEPWQPVPIRVRMGIHTGSADLAGDGHYQGYISLARSQRLMSAGHGGQVLVSLPAEQLIREQLPGDVWLRDLGERRLKDLVRPEHIYQLMISDLPNDFPPIKTLDAYRHNLPAQLTSFIGREKEIPAIKKAVLEHRLVTLTGPGGTGKTRLALQVAAEALDEFADGVWLAELAPLSDPDLLPQTLLSAFGMKEQPGRPAIETLTDRIREATLLLLVDNCEHLTQACAVLLGGMLEAAHGLKIMVTSREALGVSGEWIWRVPSLSVPDRKSMPSLADLAGSEAVQLFTERARLVRPGFALTQENASSIVEICARLDGIPLAIELAAARLHALNPEQIASRLNDRFRLLTGGSRRALERHQTLRAAVDWSYNLLSEAERDMLQRLSVFGGGWTLEAAEGMATGDRASQPEWLDLLASLASKSLLHLNTDSNRYAMLETIRQYVYEKLADSGNVQTYRAMHMRYFLRLAEELEPRLYNAEGARHLDALEAELDNFRLAIDFAVESGEAEAALRFVAALNRLWFSHCYFTEGSEWTRRALAISRGTPALARAKALATGGQLGAAGSRAESKAYFEQSAEAYREAGELAEMGNVLIWLSWHLDDPSSQRALAEEGLAICREYGNKRGIAHGLGDLGTLAHEAGDYTRARQLYEESLSVYGEMQRENGVASTLYSLGMLSHMEGDDVAARQRYRQALALFQKLKDRRQIAYVLSGIATLLAHQENRADAAALQGYIKGVLDELGSPLTGIELEDYRLGAETLAAAMGAERYKRSFDEGRTLTVERAIELALTSV